MKQYFITSKALKLTIMSFLLAKTIQLDGCKAGQCTHCNINKDNSKRQCGPCYYSVRKVLDKGYSEC